MRSSGKFISIHNDGCPGTTMNTKRWADSARNQMICLGGTADPEEATDAMEAIDPVEVAL
jgi:hypothetical protein